MVLEIRFHSTLRQYAPQGSAGIMTVHIPPDRITVKELLRELKVNLEEVETIMVNGLHCEIDHILADGDRIGVFPKEEE